MYFLFYNVVGICVLMCLGVVCPRYAAGVEHAHYMVHIVSIIQTRGNSYITSIDMKCGNVANLNYTVLLPFHKLTLENKCFYLHYSTTELDNTILLNAIQLLIFCVCLETLFTIEIMLKTLCIHCDLNQIIIVFHMRKQHCSVDIVACICCACSGCSAHIVYGSDELRCYLKIVLLFICLLGHNLIQYSQFHLTTLWRIFLNRYIFIGYIECCFLICCQGLNVRTLFSMMYLIPCISIMISTCSCILCLSFSIMFLVCGDVTTRIFSACGHASLKLRGIVIARMSPKCSINNINIVAKFY